LFSGNEVCHRKKIAESVGCLHAEVSLSIPIEDHSNNPSSGYSDTESDSDDAEGADDVHSEDGLEETSPTQTRKTLHNADEIRDHYLQRHHSRSMQYEAVERKCAQDYISQLLTFLRPVLTYTSANEVDELLQQFASDVCTSECHNYRNTKLKKQHDKE
jgi:hypothetical protein